MAKKLQLTGFPRFSSPLTYGVSVLLNQIVNVTDEDAVSLLALTAKNPDTSTVGPIWSYYTGANPINYDFTGEANPPLLYDGSLSVTPLQLFKKTRLPLPGTLLRDKRNHPYGYADGKGMVDPILTPAEAMVVKGIISPPDSSPAYVMMSPDTTVLPTITNLVNSGAVTITPVEINGERWLRFTSTATATAGVTSYDIAFNTALPYPVAADSFTAEFIPATPIGSPMVAFLGVGNTYTINGNANWSPGAASQNDPISCIGHTALTVHRTRFNLTPTGYSGESIQQPFDVCKLRVNFSSGVTAGQALTFYLRSIIVGGAAKKGRLAIIADDGYASFLQRGVPILERRGLKSTMSIIAPHPNFPSVGIDSQTLYATTEGLKRYVAAGNFCVPHGPCTVNTNLYTGALATGFGGMTVDQLNDLRVADMVYCRDWLVERGLADKRSAACYVWPQGIWNAGTGATDLLDKAYAAGFRLGRSATGHPSGAAISTTNYERYTHLRLLSQQNRWRMIVPYLGHTYMGATNTPDDATETANIAKIVLAIQNLAAAGADGMMMLHQVVSKGAATAAGIQIETDRLDTLAAACQSLVAAGTLEVVGLPEMVDYRHVS